MFSWWLIVLHCQQNKGFYKHTLSQIASAGWTRPSSAVQAGHRRFPLPVLLNNTVQQRHRRCSPVRGAWFFGPVLDWASVIYGVPKRRIRIATAERLMPSSWAISSWVIFHPQQSKALLDQTIHRSAETYRDFCCYG